MPGKVSEDKPQSALLERFLTAERVRRIDSVLSRRTNRLTVVLDRIRNPHNVSAVLRSADAFGLCTVHLVGEHFEFSRGVTLGSERWLNVIRYKEPSAALSALKKEGFEIVVMQSEFSESGKLADQPTAASVAVNALPFDRQLALVFGNEISGVSDPLRDAADHYSHVPMLGFVESLNISVACAICLYTARAKFPPEKAVSEVMADKEQEALRLQWMSRDVKGAEQILREHRSGKQGS